jgi:GT2 family glycosyltransferase
MWSMVERREVGMTDEGHGTMRGGAAVAADVDARAAAPGGVGVTVVIATADRRQQLLHTLDRLAALPERPPVVVVDNGSVDGSVDAVRTAHPEVTVVALPTNRGATARNVGVARAATPFVAFSDDDSWWAPGALARAAGHLTGSPDLAVVQAKVLVGEAEAVDPTCAQMAASPLPRPPGAIGPVLLGFVACGAVVRRSAFLDAGGFDDLLFFLGEEQLLAVDLAAAGWHTAYAEDVVAHHHPIPGTDRQPAARARLQHRNALLTCWLRRPWSVVARDTMAMVTSDPRALADALARLPKAARRRRPLPASVERGLRRLELEAA